MKTMKTMTSRLIIAILALCGLMGCKPCKVARKETVIRDSLRIERLIPHPIEPRESGLEAWMECDERGRVLLVKIEELEDERLSLSMSLDSIGHLKVKASTPPDTVWTRADSVVIHNETRVPYPVERELTKWERVKVSYGGWAIGCLLFSIGFLLFRKRIMAWIARLMR